MIVSAAPLTSVRGDGSTTTSSQSAPVSRITRRATRVLKPAPTSTIRRGRRSARMAA
jgi:hypothetical protein